jgi:hypothetical protein
MLQELISKMGQIQSVHEALTAAKTMDENWDKMVCLTIFLKCKWRYQ